MYKIGVIGRIDSIQGFAALGMDLYPVQTAQQGRQALHHMANENYAIIYITEQLSVEIEEDIDSYKDCRLPAVIPIPGVEGSLGIGLRNVKKSVERAVGSDILFKD